MISEEERIDYLNIMGKKGLRMLGIIESLRPVVDQIETSPFKEVLNDDIEKHKDLFNKIYKDLITDGKADPMDIVRLQVRHEHIMKVANDLAKYNAAVEHVHTMRINGTDQKAV